jgi:hypothetical protein
MGSNRSRRYSFVRFQVVVANPGSLRSDVWCTASGSGWSREIYTIAYIN